MKKGKKVFLFILIELLVVFSGYVVLGINYLVVNEYNLKTDKTDESFSFVLISDLHNKEFGKDNKRLIRKIKEQEPEFIAIAGDMNIESERNTEVAVSLVKSLSDIAPVYYAPGNHEINCDYESILVEEIENAGAIYLSDRLEYISVGNDVIMIGGLRTFPYFEYDAPEYNNPQRYFFDDFLQKQEDCFSILLCHYPETFIWRLKDKKIDLMLCGHTHGGIVRIPYFGGVKSPNQEWFSQYSKGYFESDSAKMIITSGLGNSYSVPRINNFPEICVININ